jgi:hypothetical protein
MCSLGSVNQKQKSASDRQENNMAAKKSSKTKSLKKKVTLKPVKPLTTRLHSGWVE